MQLVGVYYEEGPPVPIPNTVVKLFSAEDTWRAAARENRSTLTFKASCFRKVLFSFASFIFISNILAFHQTLMVCSLPFGTQVLFTVHIIRLVPYFLQISLKYFLYVFII